MQTYGYDYVFALAAETVNAILADRLRNVDQKIDYTATDADTGSRVTLTARFAPWTMVSGGQNSLLNLDLPISTGSLTLTGGPIDGSHDLAGVVIAARVTLGWIGTGHRQLTFDPNQASGPTDPGYVTIREIRDPGRKLDSVAAGVLSELAVRALLANHDRIAHVFATVQPTAGLAAWLTPSEWQYHVAGDTLCFLGMTTAGAAFPAQPAVDPSALRPGAGGVVLVAQEVFFANVVLPAVQTTFPDGTFQLTAATISNTGPFQVGRVRADSYALTASPAGDGLAASASGGGPLAFLFGLVDLPNASYRWSVATVHPLTYDGRNIAFAADPHPVVHQDHTIPWYDWLLLVLVGVVNLVGLISTIYDLANNVADQAQNTGMATVNKQIQGATGNAVVNLAGAVDWTGAGQTFMPTAVGMSESVFVAGNLTIPTHTTQKAVTP